MNDRHLLLFAGYAAVGLLIEWIPSLTAAGPRFWDGKIGIFAALIVALGCVSRFIFPRTKPAILYAGLLIGSVGYVALTYPPSSMKVLGLASLIVVEAVFFLGWLISRIYRG